MQNRRTERGAFFPPFWKLYSHFVLIDFCKKVNLPDDEEIEIFNEGDYNVQIDSKLLPGQPTKIMVPAGEHIVNIKIYCLDKVPALYMKGGNLASDRHVWNSGFISNDMFIILQLYSFAYFYFLFLLLLHV
jgi:alpha-L-rhamnosidase